MRSLPKHPVLCALLVLVMAACSPAMPTPDPSSPAAAPAAIRLVATDPRLPCDWIGFAMVLRGSPQQARPVWLESLDGARRMGTEWPAGYTARFTPGLEVVDGATVLHEGDLVDGACSTEGDTARLAPPFTGYRLDCGPLEPVPCLLLGHRVASKSGWPDRKIAVISLGVNRAFVVSYDDGSSTKGIAPAIR